ncbi:hypothetical protein [Paenibacillus sp. QZ-Y1]|uniref:hypothetical protein n=1 Tax=Paenibacillus sp. QZ-Y1 TaxID=3414511 RepID=UPI003F7AA642
MKNLTRRILSLCLIGTLLLSACGKSDDTYNDTLFNSEEPSNSMSQPTPSTNAPTKIDSLIEPGESAANKDITPANFKEGVSIDFITYKDNFFDENIISKLSNNLSRLWRTTKKSLKKI